MDPVDGRPMVRVALARGIATLTLDRPAQANAYSYELERALHDELIRADVSPEVACIVLTAAGDTFCPGFDPTSMTQALADGVDTHARSPHPFHLALSLATPVIGAVNGACAGVGLALSLTCDIRVSATEARFSTAFAPLGLPAERGTSWFLPKIVGHGRAMELLMSGRSFSAAEALAMGLVTSVAPRDGLVDHALEVAGRLVQRSSPDSLATIKRQVYRDWTVALRESTRQADVELERLVGSPDFRRAMRDRSNGIHTDFTPPHLQERHDHV
ncbi:enoyl-CoA hydratase-related protein [Aeromicrobium panaciterrae]|uniref:enoyl-CoA hydratase-related protein n=1 Tax=Aeromicrobium panaciterrae TaxID=363861 RepID=UPI0031E48341